MVKVPRFTYGLAGGSSLSSSSTSASLARLKPTDDGIFPFLEGFPSWPPEAALFLPWRASPLGSPLSPPSADTQSSVGTNICISSGDAGSLGRGAGLQINTALFIQTCVGTDCSVSCQKMLEQKVLNTYRSVRMIAVEANIFGGVRPLLSLPEI